MVIMDMRKQLATRSSVIPQTGSLVGVDEDAEVAKQTARAEEVLDVRQQQYKKIWAWIKRMVAQNRFLCLAGQVQAMGATRPSPLFPACHQNRSKASSQPYRWPNRWIREALR